MALTEITSIRRLVNVQVDSAEEPWNLSSNLSSERLPRGVADPELCWKVKVMKA